jgi:hypothetical protein
MRATVAFVNTSSARRLSTHPSAGSFATTIQFERGTKIAAATVRAGCDFTELYPAVIARTLSAPRSRRVTADDAEEAAGSARRLVYIYSVLVGARTEC